MCARQNLLCTYDGNGIATNTSPDSKVHLWAPGVPHVGLMNLAIWAVFSGWALILKASNENYYSVEYQMALKSLISDWCLLQITCHGRVLMNEIWMIISVTLVTACINKLWNDGDGPALSFVEQRVQSGYMEDEIQIPFKFWKLYISHFDMKIIRKYSSSINQYIGTFLLNMF